MRSGEQVQTNSPVPLASAQSPRGDSGAGAQTRDAGQKRGVDKMQNLGDLSEFPQCLSSARAQVIVVLLKHSRTLASAYISFSRAEVALSGYCPMTCRVQNRWGREGNASS